MSAARLALVAFSAAVFLLSACGKRTPKELLLSDGTQIILLDGTRAVPAAGFPKDRSLQLEGNGQVYIKTQVQEQPLIVRTGLLILTVKGNCGVRVLVSSEKIGEQAEVLYGQVRATKAYPSRFSDPDDLQAGEMSMINRSIDLMEKEKFDSAELAQWSRDVSAAAHGSGVK